MSDNQLKIHIKNKESDKSDDFDWCIINDEECPNVQKRTIRDECDLNESKIINETGHGLKNECKNNTEDVVCLKENSNLDKKTNSENRDILLECDNNNRSKNIKEKSDLSQQEENNLLYCNDCPSSFSKDEDMLQHIRIWHGTTNRRRSPLTTTSDSLKHLQDLINVETKDVNLMIDSEVFEKFDNFQRDNTIQSNTDDLDKRMPGSNKLQAITKQRHKCTICNKDYTYNHYKAHMKEVHSEVVYVCTICGAYFKCERYLRRHIMYSRAHNNTKPQTGNQMKCPQCPKIFKNSDCLTHHIKNCHGDRVECEICHSKLKSVSYLKTHMRRVHYNDGKKHSCKICSKEFKSPRQAKIHMINLHPETLHPCPNCIRLFCNTVQLKIHLKRCKSNEAESVNVEELSKTGDEDLVRSTNNEDEVLTVD